MKQVSDLSVAPDTAFGRARRFGAPCALDLACHCLDHLCMRSGLPLAILLLFEDGCSNKQDIVSAANTSAVETTEDDSSSGVEITGSVTSSASTSTSSGAESTGAETSSGGPLRVQCDNTLCEPGAICVSPGGECIQGDPETGGTCVPVPPDNSCDMIVHPPPYCAVDPCLNDEDHFSFSFADAHPRATRLAPCGLVARLDATSREVVPFVTNGRSPSSPRPCEHSTLEPRSAGALDLFLPNPTWESPL